MALGVVPQVVSSLWDGMVLPHQAGSRDAPLRIKRCLGMDSTSTCWFPSAGLRYDPFV